MSLNSKKYKGVYNLINSKTHYKIYIYNNFGNGKYFWIPKELSQYNRDTDEMTINSEYYNNKIAEYVENNPLQTSRQVSK